MLKTFAMLAMVAIGASAQTAPMTPELRAFVMRAEQQRAVVDAMKQQWLALTPECTTPVLKQMNVGVVDPPVFDSIGNLTRGTWKMVGQLQGCGLTKVMSLRYWFAPAGGLMMSTMLPGNTLADPRLQNDALFYTRVAMIGLAAKDCKENTVIDTRFLQYGEANPKARPGFETRAWEEEWVVKACGAVGTVRMHFIPDATGTTISAEMAKAKQ